MNYGLIYAFIFWITIWQTVSATKYTDKEIVFDGSSTGTENPVFTDATVLSLVNSKVTIKNYAKVALPAGFFLQNHSTLTIIPIPGIDIPFSLDVNGDAQFNTGSKFIFDGSKTSYSSSIQAINSFHFSFDLGAGGLIVLQDDSFTATLPTYGSYTLGSKRPSIKIGSTITDTLKYSPVLIYGSLTIDQTDRTHLYQIDFGPNKPVVAPGNAPALSVINTKIYGITNLYANIFQNTIGGSLSTSGLHAYVPQNAFTLNLLYQPTFTNPNEEPYDILFTADQTALITIKNMIQYPSDIYQLQGPFPAIRVLSNGAGVLSSSFSDPNQLLNLAIGSANVRFRLPKPERKFDLLAIGSNRDLSPNYEIPSYSNVLTIALIGDLVIRPPFTTTHTDPKTTEILLISDYSSSDAANHQWVIGHSTITLYNQPQGDTKIIDLGNGVTEYQVLSYEPSQIQNPANPLKPYATVTRTVLYSPPPVTTVSIDQNHEHIEEVVSYFITTDSNSKIITDSKVISITTKYDPAPDPETNIIDLGNEVTEYVVISYWTTINDQGKVFTTSKVQTYSPPPVTITATTAADYVETDWISFFITTNDKGEIITDSTLFNATRDYNLPEAPHTSFGPAPPAETKTVDLGNEVTEYLVISYWTTTNEFGGLITTSSTRTYSPPPVTITATTAADYVETDWISFFITTNDKGEIITDSTLFNAIREYIDAEAPHLSSSMKDVLPESEVDYTTTIDKGDGEFETDLVSHITTKDSDGKPTTITTTIPLKPSEAGEAGEADYTTTIISDGHTITEVVSHVTTTDSDGKTITYITTMASYDQVDEGVFTSPAPYSQPPVVTTTITEDDGSSKTVVISYFPSEGEDGVTRTGTTTVSTITPGEADYTTTIVSDGHTITEVVSHVTTTDSDGKTITYTTTIFSNDWLLVDSELDVTSNYPTSFVSKENPYTTVDAQSTISSNSGNTVVTTKTPANGNENQGLSSVNGTSVSSGRNTFRSVSLIITNTLGSAGPINKPSYSTTSASSSVPQEVAGDSSKYGENVSSVGIMLPQMSKPHASSASISVLHSSSRPVISTGSRPSDVSARPTENTPAFGSIPVQSGAENDASVSSTNDNQNTHTAQSRIQQLGKTSSDLGTTALVLPSSSAVNISHTGGPSDTQIASVLQGSGFKIKVKSEVMILLVTVFLFLGFL